MKLYLASSFDFAALCQEVRVAVEQEGHTVPDVWWNVRTKDDMKGMSEEAFYDSPTVRAIAARHWRTIDACDALVLVIGKDSARFTGANIEVGYAIAKGKPVLCIGTPKRSAMYVALARCQDIPDLLAALNIIGGCPR